MANRRNVRPEIPPPSEHFEPTEVGFIEAPDTGGGSYGYYGFSGNFGEDTPHQAVAEYSPSGAPHASHRAHERGEPGDPDAVLRTAVVDALEENGCECADVYVSARAGEVLLSGSVPTPQMKQHVIRVVRRVPGVRVVRSSMERAADEPTSDRE